MLRANFCQQQYFGQILFSKDIFWLKKKFCIKNIKPGISFSKYWFSPKKISAKNKKQD